MRKLFSITTVAIFALLTACAVPQTAPQAGRHGEKLDRLERTQQELADRLQQLQDKLILVEARMFDQEKVIDELRRTKATQKVTDLGEKADLPAGMTAPRTAPLAGAGEKPSPAEIYRQAFSDYAAGRFQPAILGFRDFLETYPANDYAANAQYWLAECYYSQKQYDRAVEEFRKVAEFYPQGPKTPDALLKMATALMATDRSDQAAKALQVLREKYPKSSAARRSLSDERFLNLPQE